MKVTVVTLVVDTDDGVDVSVHPSYEAAEECLRVNYDPEGEFPHPSVDIQPLLDGTGICVYLDEHEVEIPDEKEV